VAAVEEEAVVVAAGAVGVAEAAVEASAHPLS